jgi:hypothetical protein
LSNIQQNLEQTKFRTNPTQLGCSSFLVANIPLGVAFIEVRLGAHFMLDKLLGEAE